MDEMIASDGETIAVTAEDKHVEIVSAQTDAGGKRECASVNEVAAMGVDEIGEARRAADAGKRDDFLVRIVELFQHAVERRKDGEVAATGAPRWVVGGQHFLRERRARRGKRGGGGESGG